MISAWTADFYNALQDRALGDFYRLLGRFALLASGAIVMAVYKLYLGQMLQIDWRTWLTDRYLGEWLADRTYYRLPLLDEGTDNPDQRIADDLRLFVAGTLELGLGLLSAVVTLLSFVAILWGLSGPLSLALGGLTVAVPGYLVWFALLYAAGGTWLAHRLGRPLVTLEFTQQRAEADFRFALARLREHAEPVALSRGEARELAGFQARFARLAANWWAIMRRQKRLTWFTAGYAQVAVVFPFLVAAPRYFSGAIPLGGLMQTAVAFTQVQSALSWAIEAYTSLAAWKATVDRLTGFTRAMGRARAEAGRLGGERVEGTDGTLTLEGLSLSLPSGRTLLGPTSAAIRPGQHVLVTGDSGLGKTTLFRTLAGIWPYWRGRVALPRDATFQFLPQQPYLPVGTLREALAYPACGESLDEASARQVLAEVGLPDLASQLGREASWGQVLSGGEQQRLALARALVHRPDWLFLDEATSALPEAAEAELYRRVRERLPATTLVSIGHRDSLAPFHARRLVWEPGDGAARLATVPAPGPERLGSPGAGPA